MPVSSQVNDRTSGSQKPEPGSYGLQLLLLLQHV